MKYTSIRVSEYADKIFEAFINSQNLGKTGRDKLTKTALLEQHAERLIKKIPDSFLETAVTKN